jgi:phospholipid transport system substrate-binding protein
MPKDHLMNSVPVPPRRNLFAGLFVVLAALLLPVPKAWAGPSAQDFIKGKHDELTRILTKDKPSEREAAVARVFDSMLDYQTLAQESLKDHWSTLNDEQRRQFSDILKQLVQRAYRRNIDKTLGYEVTYQGQVDMEAGTLVETRATSRSNNREDPVNVNYLARSAAGQWRVVDIVTEGASLVKGYRSQFNRIIRKEGFAALVDRMKAKLAS